MNLKKLAALAFLLSSIGFTGATAAQASPFHELSCSGGYEPAEGSYTECVPIEDSTAPDETVDGCWITEDGIDVCARTGVVEEPNPIDIDPMPIACDVSESNCGIPTCDTEVECPPVLYNTMDELVSNKATDLAAPVDNSKYLIVLGLITALLGAVAIVLNRVEFSKK